MNKNMSDTLPVICENAGRTIEVAMGTTLLEVERQLRLDGPHPFLAAYVNNRIKELNYRIYKPVTVRFIDITSFEGIRVYQRTISFILQKAVRELFPDRTLYIRHSLGASGFYCEISGFGPIPAEHLDAIKARMRGIIDRNLPIQGVKMLTDTARKIYEGFGMADKIALLDSRPRLYSKIYTIDSLPGYFYGALTPSTGYTPQFDLHPYYNGFFIALPLRTDPTRLQQSVHQEKMFDVFHQYQSWVEIMGVPTVGQLNSKVLAGDASELIKIAEAFHENKLAQVAGCVAEANRERGVRLVLISGPSSSGKTTFAKRLGVQLRVLGLNPVLISLDDYFVDREKTPRDEKGEYDYEALEAIDLGLFNDHLCRLMRGESVDIPRYDFITGRRTWHKNPLTLDDQDRAFVERPRSAEIPHLHLVLHVGGDGQPLAHRHDRQPPAAPPHARLYATRRRCRGDAFALGLRPPRRGEAHLPLPGKRRRHAQLVALLRNLGVAPLCRKDPPRGSRHGTRVRRGAAHAEVPEKLHPHPARRDPAHVYHPGVHRRQQFQVLTPASPAGQTPSPAAPRVSAATPRFAACGCQRGRLRPTEAYPCATGKI